MKELLLLSASLGLLTSCASKEYLDPPQVNQESRESAAEQVG